jgi:hypothetical protein
MGSDAPTLIAEDFRSDDADAWDAFVAEATSGTLLHTRRYLSYHGDRFADRSVVLRDRHGALTGVLPAAVDPADDARVVSHPGVTYGGLLHAGALTGGAMLDAFAAVCGHLRSRGHERLLYKAVPTIYERRPAQDDRYALARAGARLARTDLAAAIDLADRGRRGSQRKRGLSRARKAGVDVAVREEDAPALWDVLAANLAERHGERPTHTLEEILDLHGRFPEDVEFLTGRLDGDVVAGVVLYWSPRVCHTQYIAASPAGHEVNALDAVLERAIELTAERGRRYLSFGISTTEQGRELNAGLHAFKAGFGATGAVHDFWEVDLG